MSERAATIGAQLTVSSSPGDGTTVVVSLGRDERVRGMEAQGAE